MSDPTTKTCRKCGADKPLSDFPRNTTTRDRLSCWCKKCHNTATNTSARRDIERYREYHRQYDRNYNRTSEKRRKWRQMDRQRKPDHYRQMHKRSMSTPSARALRRIRNAQRRAGIGDGRLRRELIGLRQKQQRGKCYWCGALLDSSYHLDHVIPISRGGTNDPSNLVLACPPCNLSKSDKLPHEWAKSGRLL